MSETSVASERTRVAATHGVLYAAPRKARKRRRCDGHLADPHHIEVGEMFVWSALPPDHNEIGNDRWWHAAYCLDCAPTLPATGDAEGADRDE